MHNEITEKFLKQALSYWDDISEIERRLILDNIVSVAYNAGECVHSSIDDCVGMFIVKSGQLRTYLMSERGKEFTLFHLNAGNVCILSSSCLLPDITFDIFIDAQEDTQLFLLNAAILSKLHKNPVIENFALKMVANKFSAVIEAMEKMLFLSFENRLASYLASECEKRNSNYLPLTHEQIAKNISSAREVVSRTLKKFEKKEMVKLKRGGIEITDIFKIKEIATNE